MDVRAAEIGMYICELDRPWDETPFLLQGFFIESAQDLRVVRDVCEYVYIDSVKSRKSPKQNQAAKKLEKHQIKVPFDEEIEQARSAYRQTHALIKSTLDEIQFGKPINTEAVKDVVKDCVISVLNNPNALLLMTQMQSRDDYTSQHSFDVCVLSIAFGRHLGFPEKTLQELGLCGLLHDMGKMKISLDLLNKKGPLEPEEFEEMKRHTTLGRDLLAAARDLPASAVDVAHCHHERLDGSGYPRGLTAENITPFSKMVAIVDVYNAVTSERVYNSSQSHMEALNALSRGRGTHFDASLVMRFIACVGIYPPGSLVELSSGEVAIVLEVKPEKKSLPKVIVVLDENKQPVKEKVIDLSKELKDKDGNAYKIKVSLAHNSYGLDLNDFLEKGLTFPT